MEFHSAFKGLRAHKLDNLSVW